MSIERTHETSVTLAGLDIPVTVTFSIESFGSSPSGYGFDGSYDPGEGAEICILSVVTEFGRDITETLRETRPHVHVVAYRQLWPSTSCPLHAVLAGFRTVLRVEGNTLLDLIKSEILDDASLMELPQDEDWDPRDWE